MSVPVKVTVRPEALRNRSTPIAPMAEMGRNLPQADGPLSASLASRRFELALLIAREKTDVSFCHSAAVQGHRWSFRRSRRGVEVLQARPRLHYVLSRVARQSQGQPASHSSGGSSRRRETQRGTLPTLEGRSLLPRGYLTGQANVCNGSLHDVRCGHERTSDAAPCHDEADRPLSANMGQFLRSVLKC